MTAETRTPEARLARLLCALFTSNEALRVWLVGRVSTQMLAAEVAFEGARNEVAFRVVEALSSRRLIDAAFFADLEAAREGNKLEIRSVAAAWVLVFTEAPVVLLAPPALPSLPDEPYPLLLPYEHPATLGGRAADIHHLLALLRRDRIIWTLHAPSGAGKSSLLRAGLIPTLRGQTGEPAVPVAWHDQPAASGLLRRLLAQLVEEPPEIRDAEFARFAGLLGQVCKVAGARPVLILDQFEDVFGTEVVGWLGPLLAATALAPGGPVARWVLAYRHEFHGRVEDWLGDLLRYSPHLSDQERGDLRIDLSENTHRVSFALPLLGDPRGAADRLAAATLAFEEAITRPLLLRNADGEPLYPIRLPAEHAHQLAQAFARARVREPDDPQTPELQVVLNRLIEDAPVAADHTRTLAVPEGSSAVDSLIADAIGDHLRRRLDEVAGRGDPATMRDRRTAAMLLLDRLVDDDGRRRAVPVVNLERQLEGAGRTLLAALQRRGVWLVRQEIRGDVLCAVLPHDRVAAEVHRIRRDAAEIERYGLNAGLVERWRYVVARTAAWRAGDAGAVELSGQRFRELEVGEDKLPWDEATRAWWRAAEVARTRLTKRWMQAGAALTVLLAVFLGIVWVQVDRKATEIDVRSKPPRSGDPLRALHVLQSRYRYDGAELARVLGGTEGGFDADQRDELLGVGPMGLTPDERETILPSLVAALAGHVEGTDSPESFYGALLAAGGTVVSPDRSTSKAVTAAMRAARGQPPRIDEGDGSWSPVVSGRFMIGCFSDTGDKCYSNETLHMVTLSPFRIRRWEETFAEYRDFDSSFRKSRPGDHPVFDVNWYEATAYAAWRGAALPTETQWEVAARGGDPLDYRRTAYYNGTDEGDLALVGIYMGNFPKIFRALGGEQPLTADSFSQAFPLAPRHPLGLVNIHGNLLEWTADWYALYPTDPVTDPAGPSLPIPGIWGRVSRGGATNGPATFARLAYRFRIPPSNSDILTGFRLVLPVP